jgi:hypothetical protein
VLLVSVSLKALDFRCELFHGVAEEMDGPSQIGLRSPPLSVGVDAAGEAVCRIDGASDVPVGHGQKVGANCVRAHWCGWRCPDRKCEWGWGTNWPYRAASAPEGAPASDTQVSDPRLSDATPQPGVLTGASTRPSLFRRLRLSFTNALVPVDRDLRSQGSRGARATRWSGS